MNGYLKDETLFRMYLAKGGIYGEYGAGDTTYFASLEPAIKEIHSVESDSRWIEDVRKRINGLSANNIMGNSAVFYYKEMDTAYKTWGKPGPKATELQKRAYSDPIRANLDYVLIDGRFRVATALKLHQAISDDTIVAFDDFLNRKHYHVVMNYYTLIDKGETMVILKRKSNSVPPDDLIRKYELVED